MILKKYKGMTLIEIVIAVAILGIVATVILGLFSISVKTNSDASIKTKAVTVLQNTFERIKSGDTNVQGEEDNFIIMPPEIEQLNSNLYKVKVSVYPKNDASKVYSMVSYVSGQSLPSGGGGGTGGSGGGGNGGGGSGGGGSGVNPPKDIFEVINKILNDITVIIIAIYLIVLFLYLNITRGFTYAWQFIYDVVDHFKNMQHYTLSDVINYVRSKL